jgi:hypothetical protein
VMCRVARPATNEATRPDREEVRRWNGMSSDGETVERPFSLSTEA